MTLIALTYRKLVPRDFKILGIVEREMARYEYVPLEVIERRARMPSTHVALTLQKLNRLKLLRRRLGDYVGYRLTYLGLDMLALHSLVERGVLQALGTELGVGKESDVYSGLTPSGERVIVKFHRVGRTSFQRVARVRSYAGSPGMDWFRLAKIAGQREYRALEELYKAGALVPKPYSYSRHVVVTAYIEGVELYAYRSPMDPEAMLGRILDTLRIAYLEVGIVHGDLSEYNVLVSVTEEGDEEPYIIDWPQYVEREHPSAPALLRRDVEYITRFFRKRYGVNVDSDKALGYVKGEAEDWS